MTAQSALPRVSASKRKTPRVNASKGKRGASTRRKENAAPQRVQKGNGARVLQCCAI